MDESFLPALKKTRTFLRTHKWGKGKYHDLKTDRYCVIGAFREVCENNLTRINQDKVEEYLTDNCVPQSGNEKIFVTEYNDAPKTKKKDIIAVLDCAIKKLEASNAEAE